MTKGRGGPGREARRGRDRWPGPAGNNGGPRLPPGAHLPPVPSEFSLRLPEESCWAPTHPPMGAPGASSATSGRSSGPAAASASSGAAAAELRTSAPLRSPAAAQPPPPSPLHPPPWLGPFLRAHFYLSPRAARPAGLARAPPSPPARPRQAGAGPSRAGRGAHLTPSQPRAPACRRAPRRSPASVRPHRPPPHGTALRIQAWAQRGPPGKAGGRGRGRPRADWLRAWPRAEGRGRRRGGAEGMRGGREGRGPPKPNPREGGAWGFRPREEAEKAGEEEGEGKTGMSQESDGGGESRTDGVKVNRKSGKGRNRVSDSSGVPSFW